MIFVDVNTFYFASDGGVKTFYDAKIEWFKKHPEHQYYLVFPNRRITVEKVAPNIHLIQAFGLKGIIGKNRLLMIDFGKVVRLVRKIKPDVMEVGDPLLTPFFGLYTLRTHALKGVLSSFHHSDPINTYVRPWAYGEKSNIFKRMVAWLSLTVYLFSHKRIPYSMVASRTLKQNLEELGIKNIVVRPFGVQDIFFKNSRVRSQREKRLLFAGRLEHEKAILLIKKVIPRLLEIEDVHITVMGKGAHENFFKALKHPRFEYLGYIEDRKKVEEVFRQNSIFLAPGPFETFGIGVLEAMANGMIVVGPNQGGTGELLASMNSPFIFQAHDIESFYQTILKALDCDFAEESKRSLKKSKDFSTWDIAIGEMINYYIEKAALKLDKQVNEQESPNFVA
jgi:alpha-1,6-mannosyltransferase